MWIPIPLVFATSLGLAALALDLPVTTDEADQGLIAVAAAQYVLGKGNNSVSKYDMWIPYNRRRFGQLVSLQRKKGIIILHLLQFSCVY